MLSKSVYLSRLWKCLKWALCLGGYFPSSFTYTRNSFYTCKIHFCNVNANLTRRSTGHNIQHIYFYMVYIILLNISNLNLNVDLLEQNSEGIFLNNSSSVTESVINIQDLWVGDDSESSVDGETVHSESSNVDLLCSTSCYFSRQLHCSYSGSYWLSNILSHRWG